VSDRDDRFDAIELAEFEDERRARNADRCQCGGDMPGRCPGPANCPMCQTDEETDA
jgi:hypothetical protein